LSASEAAASAKSVTGFSADRIEMPVAAAAATKILAMKNRSEMTALPFPIPCSGFVASA